MKGNWLGPVVLALAALGCGWWAVSVQSDPGCIGPRASYGVPGKLLLEETAIQWRRPMGEFPELRFSTGETGDHIESTAPSGIHAGLPVVSVLVEEDDLFGADRGIYTIGNAFLNDLDQASLKYLREPRWWKYPGNYLFRGKEWERHANIEIFDSAGTLLCNERIGLRINGNTTRGFPQKALRVSFKENKPLPLFGSGARTYDEIVLRASGNDQDRSMFRDAVQHRLCESMPFDVSRAVQSVVYINGAYWGIHNIRERVEDDELAIRHGLKKKHIVILADRAVPYRNDDDGLEAKRFKVWLKRMERVDATSPSFVDSLEAAVDVEGFLNYMAAQIIFGNTDWPDQNVKFWRYTGARDTINGKSDGRWRFIMGDSDLGFGYAELPATEYPDMFEYLERKQGPIARLFKCCLRSAELEERFGHVIRELFAGPLSSDRMVAMVESMADNIDTEMHMHVRRWRRPVDHANWQGHVQAMVTFARGRPSVILKQWEARKQH
jgi:CotH kinase protein